MLSYIDLVSIYSELAAPLRLLKGTVNEKLSDFAKFLFFTRLLDTMLMSKFMKKNYKIIKRTEIC